MTKLNIFVLQLSLVVSWGLGLEATPVTGGYDFIKIPATHMTQSQAHMSIPAIRGTVQAWYDIDHNTYVQSLWEQVVAKERALNDTHYVFYNAFTNEWRVPQDLYLNLYAMFHPVTFDVKTNVFRAFRWLPVDNITPEELIKKEMLEHGMLNDNEWHVKQYLLSTNVALFGNVGFAGECTFEYYLTAKSNTKVSQDIFKGILDVFGASYKYLPEIEALAGKYLKGRSIEIVLGKNKKTYNPQTLSQIFIPKEMVDKVAYLSWVQGVPYDSDMVAWVMGQSQPKLVASPQYTVTQQVMKDIQALFKDKQTQHPLFKQILEGVENGKYRISTILNKYKATPEFIPGLNNLQARLIVTPEFVGSAGSGVQVFDYDTIPIEKRRAYERELDSLVHKIFAEFLAKNALQHAQPSGKTSRIGARALDTLAQALRVL